MGPQKPTLLFGVPQSPGHLTPSPAQGRCNHDLVVTAPSRLWSLKHHDIAQASQLFVVLRLGVPVPGRKRTDEQLTNVNTNSCWAGYDLNRTVLSRDLYLCSTPCDVNVHVH